MSITFQDLAVSMIKCEQAQGQSVYQHGVSVYQYLEDLVYNLENENDIYPFHNSKSNWKLPDWIFQYKTEILSNLHEEEIISKYLHYHDVGKPYCREVDSEGKVHFPNHAEVSKKLFLEAGGCEVAANLIGWDMKIHACSSVEIDEMCKIWTVEDACTLLLASLAELHSNARMFSDGHTNVLESTSFKIKYKQLDRRGKQICKHYFGEKNENRTTQK